MSNVLFCFSCSSINQCAKLVEKCRGVTQALSKGSLALFSGAVAGEEQQLAGGVGNSIRQEGMIRKLSCPAFAVKLSLLKT